MNDQELSSLNMALSPRPKRRYRRLCVCVRCGEDIPTTIDDDRNGQVRTLCYACHRAMWGRDE